MDLYDHQWSSFRSGLPLLMLLAASQSVICALARRRGVRSHYVAQLLFGLGFVTVLNGYRILFSLAIATVTFVLTRAVPKNHLPAVTWIVNLCLLAVISLTGESWTIPFVPEFRGMSGWGYTFNMMFLKLVSFGVDASQGTTKSGMREADLGYKSRQDTPRPIHEYSYLNFLAYVFYSPLFIGGPIISFNAWQSQMLVPQTAYSRTRISVYGLRWLGAFFTLEVFLHFFYSNAIAAQQSDALKTIRSFGLIVSLAVTVLLFMWLKFTLIWRFFRFWSLLNGIETPENMNRCVMNNYSMAQFWKDWHASYNTWLIRYVYIPLGGSKKNRILNIFIVFTFVALWHEFSWRVLHWAWIVTAVIAPELLATHIYRTRLAGFRKNHPELSKLLKATFASMNVFCLIVANMVGYVFGLEGLMTVMRNAEVASALASVLTCVFCGVNWMIWYEGRKGRRALANQQ